MVLTYQSSESNRHKNANQFAKSLSNPGHGFGIISTEFLGHKKWVGRKMVALSESMFLRTMISLQYLDHFIISSMRSRGAENGR